MMKIAFRTAILASLFITLTAHGQDVPVVDSLKTFVVSATKTPASREVVPARVSIIELDEISAAAVTNTDELLTMVPGVLVNRSWGIFSKNSAVTMRGLSGSARVLVLLDGVPLNRAGGGGINWHLVGTEQITRIEVLSGPASSLYGQNAMGGVIQLFTSRPADTLKYRVGVDGGSMGTWSGSLSAGRSFRKGKYFLMARTFYREGDGYILTPEEQRLGYETKAFLQEGNMSLSGGVSIKPGHEAVMTAMVQTDKRGTGIRVFEPLGGYNSYLTQLYSVRYTGRISRFTTLNAVLYNQSEHLYTLDEKVNNQGIYKLVDSDTRMNDFGGTIHLTHKKGNHRFTTGGEARVGQLEGTDIYRTSTDRIEAGGKQSVGGIFIQDEIALLKEHLFVVAGLRYDMATFTQGFLHVENPTKETGFTEDLADKFSDNSWSSLSPRLALRYRFNPLAGVYISAGKGFSAPKLNDLTSSGKIRKGFKLANPELGPEVIYNFELGANLKPFPNLEFTPSLYYSFAESLQYQVSTGDSMDVSGELRPVLQVRNVAGVRIRGAEMKAEYIFRDWLALYGTYSYSVSLLQTAGVDDPLVSKLDGKDMSEVPLHLASAGALFKQGRYFGKFEWNYTGELWYNDENTIQTESYSIFNLKTGYQLSRHLLILLTVQDLLDRVPIDKKGLLAPGRFLMLGLRFEPTVNK
jgi:iron complex outermembrane recepter protein